VKEVAGDDRLGRGAGGSFDHFFFARHALDNFRDRL
jgi:hypothetical protein